MAQRIFCAKDEKNSLYATLWFNIAHYALRPWAWILTALTVVVLYPQFSLPGADAEGGFVRVWVDYLPGAFRGLMLAAFAAAYMSTVATQLNWGSSYLVNDFYRRFLARHRSDRALCNRFQSFHHGADGRERGRLLRHAHGGGRLGHGGQHRRGHGSGLPAALVLVAHQRLVGNLFHGHGRRRSPSR